MFKSIPRKGYFKILLRIVYCGPKIKVLIPRSLLLFIFCASSTFSQELTWKEIQSDIDYLNSQRVLFSRVENWLEGTRVESVLMDSVYIQNGNDPKKAALKIYHSGSHNSNINKISLKKIDSVTNNDYVINLHVSTLDPPVNSMMYKQIDLFQGNLHVLHFVVERFKRIVDYYKTILND